MVGAVLHSVAPAKGLTRSQCRYTNAHGRFSFETIAGSKLLEHKWGSTSVTYIPVQTFLFAYHMLKAIHW